MPGKRKDLSLREKRVLLVRYDALGKCSQRKAALSLNVSQPLLCKILKSRAEIEEEKDPNTNLDRKRKRAGKSSSVEEALLRWFQQARHYDIPVDNAILLGMASTFAEEYGISDFTPTAGWLTRWKRRENVVLKKACVRSMAHKAIDAKPKVYVTRGDLPDKILDILRSRCEVDCWSKGDIIPRKELLKGVKGKDAIYCMLTDKIDTELLDAAGPKLRVVATVSVGFDHIDVTECRKRGIRIGYTPGVLTDATADLTVALLLATARRLIEAAKDVTSGGWKTWHPFYMSGQQLTGSTVGIVGLGRIGQAVVRRLVPFGVKQFLYCGTKAKPEGDSLGARYTVFKQLLSESDFVIVCCSLNEKTKGMFNRDAFRLMKPTAVFINTSRGLIVDQDALYDALTTGQIWAAGIDVTTPEPLPPTHRLTSLKNCVILPHIGSSTDVTREQMSEMSAYNILAALQGEEMPAEL